MQYIASEAMAVTGQVDAPALERDALAGQTQALFETMLAGETNDSAGPDDAMPRHS